MLSTKLRSFYHEYIHMIDFLRVFGISCVFGMIPGSWIYGIPLVFLYGLTKQQIIAQRFLALIWWVWGLRINFFERLGRFIGEQLNYHHIPILKGCATLFLIASMSMPYCFFGIYGLYRFSNEEWVEIGFRRIESFVNFASGFAQGAKLGRFAGSFLVASLLIYLLSPYVILELGFLAVQIALVSVGFVACKRDLMTAIKQPWRTTVSHVGKMLGVLWGRWLAYEIFPGRIVGSMGPAIGQVEMQGISSGILSSFLQPNGGWFTFQTGLASILSSRIFHFFNNLLSSVFFSYNMKVWGDFHGYLGPSSFQVFLLMTVGCLIGWGAERFIDKFFENVAHDAQDLEKIKYIHAARWHIAFVVSSTPMLLLSNAGSTMIALGGSLLGGAILTAAIMGLAFAAIYGVPYVIKHHFFREKDAVSVLPEPAPPVVVAEADLRPAPSFTPAFQQQAQQPVTAPVTPPIAEALRPEV